MGLWTGFSMMAVAELITLLMSVVLYCFGCTKGDIEKKQNKVSIPKESEMSKHRLHKGWTGYKGRL